MFLIKFGNPQVSNFQQIARYYGKHNKKYLYNNGKTYNGITYYPREPEQVDPCVEPAKLFRVQRIKPLKGSPYWEKKMLKELSLDGKLSDFTVVKNIPENNARLWKIKHLIKVDPVTYPYGEEPQVDDVNFTILKENGECIVTKKIGQVEKRLEALEEFNNGNSTRLDAELLKKDSRLQWLNPWE